MNKHATQPPVTNWVRVQAFLTDNYLGIVSEYASMGDLADYIDTRRSRGKNGRGLPEAQTRQLFQQLVFAIDFW